MSSTINVSSTARQSYLRPALVLLILLTLITGIAYPLLTTGLANILFSHQAKGSLVMLDGEVVGSSLIGQNFTQLGYFVGRPSATADMPYNALASGGSNLAISNPALDQAIRERIQQQRKANPTQTGPVPVDLVTASGSGLDPSISLEAAYYQAPRIANIRQMPLSEVKQLIDSSVEKATPNFFGESVVNVLKLNMTLDTQSHVSVQTNPTKP
ncbi:potassium-transporting ATPase subunit KdpC [Yersinia massiliensis]|jgi:K+-transporting ATPase ATPase C chain|uniref:Potassium-transporting ATPase KdpC subunit n=2 Tax=Yersinia TaxID=629 RepID=A0A2R4NS78_9GAMM|nr:MULTISPECIES: potassium-transporting ATPase subunit KdpC [Yersinia]HEC1648190.1 potassium-transporting ATPase subunit KdpC [Yersinia enterocolitica]ATM85163.1 potassium-transporting ATPase subunit KdpC [Yersinia frederiksenii]AVX38989.1 potassium-transporting ATPase subunit KdpC [Yersinia massiliensis]MCB5319185.1 potassium-transporting ATPase subunit KdpC [Yersinia massiliensis]MDA5547451.1 potassium-transporting ATPase subunit KdpC [Yersinia massiliensis]